MSRINVKDSIYQISFGSSQEFARVTAILRENGINRIEQLCRLKEKDLAQMRFIGRQSLERIVSHLNKCGLWLGMTDDDIIAFVERQKKVRQSRLEFEQEMEVLCKEIEEEEQFRIYASSMGQKSNVKGHVPGNCMELIVNNSIELPKADKGIDWEQRFYELAKDEFLHRSRIFGDEKGCALSACKSAETFLNILQEYPYEVNLIE